MNEILHANIFFVIASVATIIFSIIVSMVLYNVLLIVKSLRRIVERIEAASEQVADDVAYVKTMLFNGGIIARIMGFMAGARRTGRHRSKKKGDD